MGCGKSYLYIGYIGLLAACSPEAFAGLACEKLKVGQSRIVSVADRESPTSVGARYKLSRVKTNDYLIELNLTFTNTLAGRDWRAYASECLARFSAHTARKLPGVRFQLSEAADVPWHEVRIGGEDFRRSNSAEYEANASCPVVVHEVMHLLGLPDEYVERMGGGPSDRVAQPGLACRIPGPVDSVMHNPYDTLKLESAAPSQPLAKWEVDRCDCPPGVDCAPLAASASGASCPEGTTQATEMQYTINADEGVIPVVTPTFFILPGGRHRKVSGGERVLASVASSASLSGAALFPAQVRALIFPGCLEENRCYYACAANSRLPERTTYLTGLAPDPRQFGPPTCLPVPADCVDSPYKCWE